MVLVVGNVEADDFLVLSLVTLHEREDETTVLLVGPVNLEGFLATILQPGVPQLLGVADGQGDVVALLQRGGTEVACPEEDAHHVVNAVLVLCLFPLVLAGVLDAVHPEVAVLLGIGVPQLVHIVAFPLTGSLAEVERREVFGAVGKQRVTHHEEVVHLAVGPRDETGTVGFLSLIGRLHGGHGCRTYLHPDELPVEVEVVGQELTRLKGFVLYATLLRCHGA